MLTEAEWIIRVQQTLSSSTGRALIGFFARWLIYLYLPFVFFYRKSVEWYTALITAGWSVLLAFAISSMLAWLIQRARPFVAVSEIQAIVPPNIQTGSFPSSHTAIAVAIALSLSQIHFSITILVLCMAFFIGLGRIAAGMHYPTDILGGIAIGILAHIIVRFVREGVGLK